MRAWHGSMTVFRRPFLVGVCFMLGCSNAAPVLSQVDSAAADEVIQWRDPLVRQAQEALSNGRPWQARRLLDPALADSVRRTPGVILVAARAAASLGEWARVERLLLPASWMDSLGGGRAYVLLTQAALDRRADSVAVARAHQALATARDDVSRGERLVLLARALDRLDHRDSSRVAYERAAELLPGVGDWLRLRAAGVTSDSAIRRSFFARVRGRSARDRIAWTEALARERTGDPSGALREYEALGSRIGVLRLRVTMSKGDSSGRVVLKDTLLGELRSGSPDRAVIVQLLDELGALNASEELRIARHATGAAPTARIVVAYERALEAGAGTDADRLAYGALLSRVGRDREAVDVFARIRAPQSVAASARYQQARSLVYLGNVPRARAVLRGMVRDFPADTSTAWALFLLSDLAADEGRDGAARSTYCALAHQFPATGIAMVARFRAAIIALASGETRTAAIEFDSLRALYPRGSETLAAGYWSGRAWSRLGNSARAAERWREVIATSPLSYYSAVSARALGETPWAPPESDEAIGPLPEVEHAVSRARLLDRLGMGTEAELEYERLDREADENPARVLPTARAYAARGLVWRAMRVATRALERTGSTDARLYRFGWPLLRGELLVEEAKRSGLDPAMVAALMRQESSYNPRATSAAGARGLMQILPAVGEQIARGLHVPDWSAALLYEPEVSVVFGMRHLAAAMRRYEEPAVALAAYNAGGSRVARWRRKGGAADVEMFIERISFVETRDYVRIVLRNRDLYRALHGL